MIESGGSLSFFLVQQVTRLTSHYSSLVTNAVIVTILWILPIYPLIQSSAAALMSDYTSIADRGKGLGLLESALSLGGGVGPLAGGLIADVTQQQAVILFSLAVALASAVSSQALLREKGRIILPTTVRPMS